MNLDISKVISKYRLTSSEATVLIFVIENIHKANMFGVRGVAKECYCSTSVVMSLAKKLGYNGFLEMLDKIVDEIKGNNNMISKSEKYILEFSDYDYDKRRKLVDILKKHEREAVYIIGSGFCEIISKYMQEKFMLLGFFSFFTWHLKNFDYPHTENPLLICISKSGETDYITDKAELFHKKGYDILTFTHNKENSLKNLSTLNFSLYDGAVLDESNYNSNIFYANILFLFEFLIGCYLETDDRNQKK
ncbi:MAG: MurR/RpiR family transcriptional regulator [Fusobacteriaceae bacterium]